MDFVDLLIVVFVVVAVFDLIRRSSLCVSWYENIRKIGIVNCHGPFVSPKNEIIEQGVVLTLVSLKKKIGNF